MNLFVYGTLKRNFYRNFILQKYGAEFIEEVATEPNYSLYNLGSFPGMTDEGDYRIHGELWEVPDIAVPELDRIEGSPAIYYRNYVMTETGEYVTYFLNPALLQGFPDNGLHLLLPDGRW